MADSATSSARGTTVLVTGATGFVGRRLTRELVERGYAVRAMTRQPDRYDGPGEPVGADVSDPESLEPALVGAHVAVYLVHSLDSDDFEERDRAAATAFGRAAAKAGVRQIVYLGGLGAEDGGFTGRFTTRTWCASATAAACASC